MNRWSNNYYTQQLGKDHSPRRPQAHPSAPSLSHSRRGSLVKTGNNGFVNLCVFRVAHLTQLTLKSFIERQGVQVLNIEQVSLRGGSYKSFSVTVKEKDAPRLLSRNFWPGLVSCRPLQDVDPKHNEVFSRRHAHELYIPASNSENKSPYRRRRISRVGGASLRHMLEDKPKTVQAVGVRPYGAHNISERKAKANDKANSNNTKNETKNGKELNKLQKEGIQTNTKKSRTEKKHKSTAHNGNKSAKVQTKTIRVKHRNSDDNSSKGYVAHNTAQRKTRSVTHKSTKTRKPHIVSSSVGKNRKPMSGSGSNKNSKNKGISYHKIISDGRLQSEKSSIISSVPPSQVSSSRHATYTAKKKYRNVNSTNGTYDDKHIFNEAKVKPSRWITPLRGLLSVSSEQALSRLLGPNFDRLLTQYDLTDEEIFLGVRVLAHCARAQEGPKKLQQLVYKICQPQVMSLIKEFTRTVEQKHKARAERYFWDLGEFLDLYIVHNIFLQGMLSLFTACLSKILALNFGKFVSDDLVKVYRGMHTKVFKNIPHGLA